MTTVGSVLSLEVNTATRGGNLITNHSAAFGFWGWTASSTNTKAVAAGFVFPTSTGGILTAKKVPVTAGQYVGLSFRSRVVGGARNLLVRLSFYNVSDALVSTVNLGPYTPGGSLATTTAAATLVPATAVKVAVIFEPATSAGGAMTVNRIMLVTAATAPAAVTKSAYPSDNWVNIVGKALSVTTDSGNVLDNVEDKMNPGLLTAVVIDPTIDPAVSSSLRKGRPIRLRATAGSTVQIWQGTIETADTVYDESKGLTPKPPRITITALDVVRVLDSTPVAFTPSVGGFAGKVAAAAFEARLPTSDGSSIPDPGTGQEARDDAAKASDWIRRACNTHGGYAWVDEFNMIQQRLIAGLATTPAVTFSDDLADAGALYYTGIGLNYGSRSLVNALNVIRINLDETEDNGSKTYGPYVALDSEADNDRVTADVEITAGSPSAIANVLLPIFATPKVYPTEIRFNALRDLAGVLAITKYMAVRVKRTSPAFDATVRVLRIRHEIVSTVEGGTWQTYVSVRPLESGAAVVVDSPSAGADTGPGDIAAGGFPRLGSRYRSTNLALTASATVYTTVPYDTAITDDGIPWDAANSRFTVPKAGRYAVGVGIRFSTAANTITVVGVAVNGVLVARNVDGYAAAATKEQEVNTVITCAAGDLVSALVQAQTAGTTIQGDVGRDTRIHIAYIGP